MDMNTFMIGGCISAIAIITGLVKVAREAGLPSKYAPAMSVSLGGIIGLSAALFAESAAYLGLIGGIAAGLLSCGLYDVGKKSA